MKNLLLLFIAAFCFNACNAYKTINEDPKARYKLHADMVTSVMRTLKHLRDTKVITNDVHWSRIKVLTKSTMKAFDDWGTAIENGKSNPDVEKLAMNGLNALKEFKQTYE